MFAYLYSIYFYANCVFIIIIVVLRCLQLSFGLFSNISRCCFSCILGQMITKLSMLESWCWFAGQSNIFFCLWRENTKKKRLERNAARKFGNTPGIWVSDGMLMSKTIYLHNHLSNESLSLTITNYGDFFMSTCTHRCICDWCDVRFFGCNSIHFFHVIHV